MPRRFVFLTGFACTVLLAEVAFAQQIAVQQPVIRNFSVGTTVSVPDRGSTFLGGVSAARSGRITTGPFPSGSAFGLERESSFSSVQVYIHDFESMDAELLASTPGHTRSKLEPRIANRLQRREGSVDLPSLTAANNDRRAEAERLAEQAETRGRFSVAKLHWQRAMKHGSTRATQRLAKLASRP